MKNKISREKKKCVDKKTKMKKEKEIRFGIRSKNKEK